MSAAIEAPGTVQATVDVELQDACAVASLPGCDELRRWVGMALRVGREVGQANCGLVVRVVSEAESRELNRRFRHKDRATNVLSFPAAGADEVPGLPASAYRGLGDLVICGPLLEREAAAAGRAAAFHWAHLVVHGTLHLLGYDHQSEPEASVMERLEAEALQELGFGDPYA